MEDYLIFYVKYWLTKHWNSTFTISLTNYNIISLYIYIINWILVSIKIIYICYKTSITSFTNFLLILFFIMFNLLTIQLINISLIFFTLFFTYRIF